MRETPSRQMQRKRTDEADGHRSLLSSFEKIDALISRSCVIYAVCLFLDSNIWMDPLLPPEMDQEADADARRKIQFSVPSTLATQLDPRQVEMVSAYRDQTIKQTCFGLTPILLLNLSTFGTQETLNLLSLADSYISSLSRL